MNMEDKILQIPLEDIIPNRFQPRLNFDDEALQELAQSIKEHGIIQPLVLRKLGDKYEIIAGERRYKASQIAGLTTVPAVISNIDDDKSAEVALVENLQRKNLTSIEEAKSYKNILDRGYLTQEQLADKLGISQSTIANKLRLLNLCDEVQDALLKEKISERHARALLAIKDPTEQIKWLNKILNDRLTVRQLDIEIKKSLKNSDDEDESDIPIVELTPNLEEIKENALDIHPQEGLHDIESMLKPSMPGEKTFDLSNPVDDIETLDIGDETPENIDNSEQPVQEDNTPPNKFFNFLEDESANMNEDSSIDDFYGDRITSQVMDNSNDNKNDTLSLDIDNTNYDDNQVLDNSYDKYNTNEQLGENNYETEIVDNPYNEYTYEEQPASEVIVEDPNYSNNEIAVDNSFNEDTISPQDNDFVEEEPENNQPKFFNFMDSDDSNDDNNEIENNDEYNVDNSVIDNDLVNFDTFGNGDESNNIIEEIKDDNTYDDPYNSVIEEEPSQNEETEIVDNNIYSVDDPVEETTDTNQFNDNIIDVVEAPKAEVFDPMSMVDTLEPGYEEKQQIESGTDLTTAISKVRETRDLLESMGFKVTLEEADAGDFYNLNMNIIK